jgi:hypothetical protein
MGEGQKITLELKDIINAAVKLITIILVVAGAIAYAKYSLDGINQRLTRIEKETFKNFSVDILAKLEKINKPIAELIRQSKEDNQRRIMFERIFIDVISYFLMMSDKNISMEMRESLADKIKARLEILDNGMLKGALRSPALRGPALMIGP